MKKAVSALATLLMLWIIGCSVSIADGDTVISTTHFELALPGQWLWLKGTGSDEVKAYKDELGSAENGYISAQEKSFEQGDTSNAVLYASILANLQEDTVDKKIKSSDVEKFGINCILFDCDKLLNGEKHHTFGLLVIDNGIFFFVTYNNFTVSEEEARLLFNMSHCEMPNWFTWWYNSDIHDHLNGPGIDEIFTKKEQEAILLSNVKASHHPMKEYTFQSGGEPDSQSKLFLLSVEEVNLYFLTEEEKKCGFDDGEGPYPWWLRTKGYREDGMAAVGATGKVIDNGIPHTEALGVRPAMWIDYHKATEELKLSFHD